MEVIQEHWHISGNLSPNHEGLSCFVTGKQQEIGKPICCMVGHVITPEAGNKIVTLFGGLARFDEPKKLVTVAALESAALILLSQYVKRAGDQITSKLLADVKEALLTQSRKPTYPSEHPFTQLELNPPLPQPVG